jgi:PPOX class probable F420-dependent enzyme
MAAGQDDLWALVAARQQGVLATVTGDASPQLSNVLYVPDSAARVIRISTTADRAKARNLARNPRAALHVAGDDFWQYAAAHGAATLSDVATTPGDPATDELFTVHSAFYGTLDRAAFDQEMIRNHRLVLRLHVTRLTGVITKSGRRPFTSNS